MNKQIVIKQKYSADELMQAFDSFEEQILEAMMNIRRSLKHLRLAFHSRRRITKHSRHPSARKVLRIYPGIK